MKKIFTLSVILAIVLNIHATDRPPLVAFSKDNIDYHIQEVNGPYGIVWASDSKEPYVTGTASIPASVSYDGVMYIVTAATYYWPLKDGLTRLDMAIGIDTIDNTAFMQTSSLQEVNIPYVKWIGNSAFFGCSIRELNLSSPYLNYIGETAFGWNKQMTKVTISAPQLTEIPGFAFSYCENLATITINSNITKIGEQAFSFNKAIQSITLPASLKSMGKDVFYGNENLTEIKVLAMTPPEVTSETFSELNTNKLTVVVPIGTVGLYTHAEGWKDLHITDGTQAVENVSAPGPKTLKTFHNGHLLIHSGHKTYTPSGQEVR